MKKLLFTSVLALLFTTLLAQDTIEVQTFTFNDITKRRGVYPFPSDTIPIRKILMQYTLKCDAATTQDQYHCGEWDYLTYTTVYDKRGLLDSLYKSTYNFSVNGNTPDSFAYTNNIVQDYYRSWQYSIQHTATLSFDSTIAGNGTDTCMLFNTQSQSSRFQYLYKASDLIGLGLDSGNISGLMLYSLSPNAEVHNLKVRLQNVAIDSLSPMLLQDSLLTVYSNDLHLTQSGWFKVEFYQDFVWDGSSSILVDVSYDGHGSSPLLIRGTTVNGSGIYASGTNWVQYQTSGSAYVDFGNANQLTGNQNRTYEIWANVDAFNGGGLFQAGQHGSTGKDFSLRTMSTTDKYRAQTWGSSDFDVIANGSKGNWHHFALTYDGSTIKLYYDGVLTGQNQGSLNTGDAYGIRTGRWRDNYLKGQLDEFRIWDEAIPDSVIAMWKNKKLNAQHPHYANLKAYYSFNDGISSQVQDNGPNSSISGHMMGSSWRNKVNASNLFCNYEMTDVLPNVVFEQGLYTSVIDSTPLFDSIMRTPVVVLLKNNADALQQIADDHPQHPSLVTDTLNVWDANGYAYVYEQNTGIKIDSILIPKDSTLYRTLKTWYSPEVDYEIGRYITPYGINLDLGTDGTTWYYDVTDYRHLLVDSVDISAGNQQELIDLKFLFIKGEPEAEIKKISHIWHQNRSSIKYKDLDNDAQLANTTVALENGTGIYKVKTRITGHGHNSDDGNYPHCCEWKDNTHSLIVNGNAPIDWHIFKYNDCALNPVYPQGGTWPGAREGWCPGDIVKDVEFNISSMVTGNTVDIDYSITPVPVDNQGMGNGNYVMAMQLVQYGQANDANDAELYEVIAPSMKDYYKRINPMCSNPKVVIRNSGSQTLTTAEIEYEVSGGLTQTYTWNGSLEFAEEALVELPVDDESFWMGDNSYVFTARITKANGVQDEDAQNNEIQSKYAMPDVFHEPFIVWFKTNNNAGSNAWMIKDIEGQIVAQRDGATATTYYKDTIDLPNGCYTFTMSDDGNDGLSYWANTAQGNGYCWFRTKNNVFLKKFEPEFGHSITYSFSIGVISNLNEVVEDEELILVYPNPGKGIFSVQVEGMKGECLMEVYDQQGVRVRSETWQLESGFIRELSLDGLAKGIYYVKLLNNGKVYTEKIIMQ